MYSADDVFCFLNKQFADIHFHNYISRCERVYVPNATVIFYVGSLWLQELVTLVDNTDNNHARLKVD